MRIFSTSVLAAAALAFGASSVNAEIVTHAQAMRLAQQFFNEAAGEVTPPVTMVYKGKDLTTNKLFTPFYTFTSPRGGFVIISADNKTLPILAYSLTGKFDERNLTHGQRQLLRGYAMDVERIRYDSRVPEEAIVAWSGYPQYVYGLLHGQRNFYYTAVGAPVGEEARERVDHLITLDRADDLYSSLYSPDQWRELTDEQLLKDNYVLMGVIESEDTVWPMTVSGERNGMYRVTFRDGENPWMIRLHATEFLSDGLIADFYATPVSEPGYEEERPFEFYESTIAEFAAEEARRTRTVEDGLAPRTPVVSGLGGGRFSISLPGEVSLVRIYNVSGALVGQQTYSGVRTAWIDLGHEPGGFYLAQVFGKDTDPVTIKLYR